MTLGFSTCGAALPTILSLNAFAAFGAAVVLYVLACLLFFWILVSSPINLSEPFPPLQPRAGASANTVRHTGQD
jgi:hypothetical protein